jgi:PRD domain/PTS system IIA domain protein
MIMNERQKKIIEYLKHNTGNITTRDISDNFFVSRRTVFSDLNIIEQNLINTPYKLIRNEGKGLSIIKLEDEPNHKLKAKELIYSNRKLLILETILFERTFDIDSLEECLYISESTLVNDINIINETYLTNVNNKLIIKNNSVFLADDKYVQRTFVRFNELLLNEISQSVIQQDLIYSIYYDVLKHTYGIEFVERLMKIIYDYIKDNYHTVAEYYLDNIISNLIVLIYLKLENDYEYDSQDNKTIKKNISNNKIELIEKIETGFNINFNLQEDIFIFDLLKGNKFVPTIDGNYDLIIKTLTYQISEILDINLNDDRILFEQLGNHFPPLMYRLSNNIKINNPFIDDIKREYLTLFNAVWMVVMYNNDWLEYPMNDNEIGLLTIYFQSALDRNKVAKKIALINTTRMMNSEFISSRIKNVIPNIYVEIIEEEDNEFISNNNFDLIITTNDNQYGSIPTVNISPIVSDSDLINVSSRFTQIIFKNNNYRNIDTKKSLICLVDKYFNENTTYLNQSLKSKSDVFNLSNRKLLKENIVDKNYLDSVRDRERQGSTDIGNYVATPHGNPIFVKKNCVLAIVNKEPIQWGEDRVQVIFLICVTKNDMRDLRNLFNLIYELSNDRNIISKITKSNTYDEFRNILLNYRR